jgi:hypothetical protein
MKLQYTLRLVRWEIRNGRFERSMALMTAFAALVSGWEAYAQHLRGAFSHWLMWTPVGLTPPTVLAGFAAIFSQRIAHRVLPILAVISFVDGLVGFVFHMRGIGRMPGGWQLGRYNVVMGPPIFAPLLTCTIGVLGLLVRFLRPEEPNPLRWDRQLGDVLADLASRRGRAVASNAAHGRFQRSMALIAASFAVLAGGEAYFEHLRGSFNQRIMWTPVWVTPPMVAAAIAAMFSQSVAERVLPVAAVVTFVDGLLGFGLHLQGIRRMPGGFANLQFNFTMGPPLFAPLLFSSVGILGLIAALLRRAERRLPA